MPVARYLFDKIVVTNIVVIFNMSEALMNINFVYEVEKHPCLYNYRLKEYSRKDVTEKAWGAVGEVFNLSAMQAKERWKNLRSVFVRNLKPPPDGSARKKKYYLTDAMQFAIPFIKVAGINAPEPEERFDEDNDSQDPLSCTPPRRSSPLLTDLTRRNAPTSSNQNQKTNKKKITAPDELLSEFIKSKKSKKKESDGEESTIDNANKMFLLSLLPDLNCMTPIQIRTFKRQVIDLIDNLLIEPHLESHYTRALEPKSEYATNASSSQPIRIEDW